MIVPDTSVLVAGFDSTHPFFAEAELALAQVRSDGRLVAHTIAETFAVLSAPGGPYPALPKDVAAFLAPFVEAADPIGIAPAAYPAAIKELIAAGVVGGAVYDGLIALATRQHDAELVSFDTRAARTYRSLEVAFRLLAAL